MNPIVKLHQEYCNYKIAFKGCSKTTLRGEFYIIVPFVRHLELNSFEEFKELERQDIINYIIKRKKESDWSARTIKNNLQALSNFFEYCKQNNLVDKNPAEGIEKPKPPKNLPRLVKKEDALRILEWLYFVEFRYKGERERAKAIVGTFIFTGVRRSELLNIKNSDINFREKVIRINSGKGNKDRVIPMNDKLIEILKEYVQCDLKKYCKSAYFFVKLDGENKMGDSTIRTLFERFKKELKIDVSPHKLRHTFATLMAQSACSMPALAKMMGHSTIKTTEVYLWLDTDSIRSEIQKHPFGYVDGLPHGTHRSSYNGW
jgi:site-specific recombinase XerD